MYNAILILGHRMLEDLMSKKTRNKLDIKRESKNIPELFLYGFFPLGCMHREDNVPQLCWKSDSEQTMHFSRSSIEQLKCIGAHIAD